MCVSSSCSFFLFPFYFPRLAMTRSEGLKQVWNKFPSGQHHQQTLTMLKFRRVGRATVKKIGKVEVPPLGVNNYIQRSFASWREQNNCQKKWKPFLVLNAFEAGAYYIWNHVHWCLIWLGGACDVRHFIVQTGFKWFQTTRWLVFRGPRKSICVGVCFLISREGISRGKWN